MIKPTDRERDMARTLYECSRGHTKMAVIDGIANMLAAAREITDAMVEVAREAAEHERLAEIHRDSATRACVTAPPLPSMMDRVFYDPTARGWFWLYEGTAHGPFTNAPEAGHAAFVAITPNQPLQADEVWPD